MASIILLFRWWGSDSRILRPSQSTLCWWSHACTATLFFRSHLFTAYFYSVILFCRDLPVSPMYTDPQSRHGILYNPLFSCIKRNFKKYQCNIRATLDISRNTSISQSCLNAIPICNFLKFYLHLYSLGPVYLVVNALANALYVLVKVPIRVHYAI